MGMAMEVLVADTSDTPSAGVPRRDIVIAGAGAVLALGIGGAKPAFAQAAPGAASTQSVPPGKVAVERRGALLLVGIDRPQAQNLLDPPILIGLGKAYYQLEHDDELRVAVLHGLGANFSLGVDLVALAAAQAAGSLPPKDPIRCGTKQDRGNRPWSRRADGCSFRLKVQVPSCERLRTPINVSACSQYRPQKQSVHSKNESG